VPAGPITWYDKIDFIIGNQFNDIALMRGICYVTKGEKIGDFSTMIPPKRSAYVKFKALLLSYGDVECCVVYELVNQRNESKPIMEDYQVFIAVMASATLFVKKCKVLAAIFMARNGQFAGSKDDMKRLKESISQEHLINNTYICSIKDQTLRLKAVFHPRQASIKIILEETIEHVENGPVLY
jgi:hypothetical protein